MLKIKFIVDKILNEDPTAKLHLTTFGDYPTVQNHNVNATYCYRYELTTSNKDTFLAAVQNVDSTYVWGQGRLRVQPYGFTLHCRGAQDQMV